jgi:antitoxin MazE
MEATIIKIGNSKGLIIPQKMLKALGTQNKVTIEAREGGLFITPIDETRKCWAESFKSATSDQEPSKDLFEEIENDFDKEEWTW